MMRLLPYPLLTALLLVMWLLLNQFSLGHLVLGSIIALVASRAMAALQPAKPRIRRWDKIPLLVWLILSGGRRQNSGFVTIPLDLRDRTGLAVLACIVTSTPGTAWLEYNSTNGNVLIHVLDLVDEQEWIDTIKHRYEHLLMEIFE
jgi:multicomponent K+:H+ antiporter subunit E